MIWAKLQENGTTIQSQARSNMLIKVLLNLQRLQRVRVPPEANASNEFTVWVAKEIHAEIIATGHPSPAKLRNAMSNPASWLALQQIGLVPMEAGIITGSANPLLIELNINTTQQAELRAQLR